MSRWTPEQRLAIETVGTGLLVSAAAGSGKTSVLAERCVHLICNCPDRCTIDQLLVVTFTEAAAAEMKQRIDQNLRDRLSAATGTESDRLRNQLILVEQANISTLHSFCLRLIRQHFHRLELDPAVRVIDADEAALLRSEVVRELFHDRYEAGDEGFALFIEAYG
ncbi:MAG TPA: UvrD-helicase domain-containing protein, partial [Tepidisphaeraceae bacterium]|nr:UvrD-helicase domain-containing protein [Tepidisphaeraceae bacterium]